MVLLLLEDFIKDYTIVFLGLIVDGMNGTSNVISSRHLLSDDKELVLFLDVSDRFACLPRASA